MKVVMVKDYIFKYYPQYFYKEIDLNDIDDASLRNIVQRIDSEKNFDSRKEMIEFIKSYKSEDEILRKVELMNKSNS